MAKLVTAETATAKKSLIWLAPLVADVFLLSTAIATVLLQATFTRDLKRVQQPNWYIGLGVGYFIVFALAGWWILRRQADSHYRNRWLGLAVLVLIPNIINVWMRFSFELAPGQSLFGRDADVGLFFKFGHDANSGLTPTFQNRFMEYPQLALLLFQIGDFLVGGNPETFYWVFPAFMLVFQFGAAAALLGISRKLEQVRAGYLLAVFAATCPFLYLFNYTRFDIAPTAILLIAVYFFLPNSSKEGLRGFKVLKPYQAVLSGLLTAIAGLMKWLPAVIAPFFALAYLQAKRWRDLSLFTVSGLICTVVVLVPSYLSNSAAFWYPYQFQGERKLIGESFWYLVQYYLLDPNRTLPDRPWGEPKTILLDNSTLTLLQIGLTAIVLVLPLVFLWLKKPKVSQNNLAFFGQWAGYGLGAVAVFTLANRIFSPQFMVLIVWVFCAALLIKRLNWLAFGLAIALMTVSAGANFLVFLLGAFPDQWINYSVVLFATAWGFCVWLLVRTVRSI
jgi:Glycosyltransferase family 87